VAEYWLHKFYRGRYLPHLAYALSKGVGDQKYYVEELHKAFKEYFDVESTAEFNDHEFLTYLSQIQVEIVVEKGLMLPMPNESLDLNEMTMREC